MKENNHCLFRIDRTVFTWFGICLIAILLIHCGNTGSSITESQPALVLNHLTFEMPQNASQRFEQLVTQTELANQFKPAVINGQAGLKPNPWRGRVRMDDVSYHALFSVDKGRILFKGNVSQASGLSVSIYHPPGSRLTYNLSVRTANPDNRWQKTLQFGNPGIYDTFLSFGKTINGEATVTLTTEGSGIGAWINPRFHEQKETPWVYIVMVWDTLRYDHTSVYGYHRKTTPHLEELAADSVVYDRAFSSTSWTLPAHVSLFSGKDLSEHGVTGPQDMIGEDIPLAAEFFQQEGFVTAAFTGGGFVEDSYGFYRGFQYYSNAPGNVFSMNSAERVFSHFKNYLDSKRYWQDDLFIFLHTYQIHAPYKAPRSYIDRIDKTTEGNLLGVSSYIKEKSNYYKKLEELDRQRLIDLYDASILYTDDALLGKVVALLKEKGLYDRAMLAVLSDHGEEFYDHGSWEHGHTLYNELINIPLVIKFPFNRSGETQRGIREDGLTSICDIPGILLKESGIPYDREMFKVLTGQKDRILPVLFPVSPIIKQFPRKYSFVDAEHHFIYNDMEVNQPLFFDPAPPKIPAYELFHRSDRGEKDNLYKKQFKMVTEFKKPLKLYLNKLKQLKRKNKTLDKDLEKKLKSLGYLN